MVRYSFEYRNPATKMVWRPATFENQPGWVAGPKTRAEHKVWLAERVKIWPKGSELRVVKTVVRITRSVSVTNV